MEAIQEALITAMIGLITAFIGALTKKAIEWMNDKGLSEKLVRKQKSVRTAVEAIEQIAINESGPEKKEKAIQFVHTLLNQNGVKMSREEIDIMIEGTLEVIEKEAKENFLKDSQKELPKHIENM